MRRVLIAGDLDSYVCVYQGGWHEVYCNGENHKYTDGGSAGRYSGRVPEPQFLSHEGRCNCAAFGNRTWELNKSTRATKESPQ